MQTANTQNTHRDISSSQQNCKCSYCKNQPDLKLVLRCNIPHIHLYKHLKKREGPPNKEQNKDVTVKYRITGKKEDNLNKNQHEQKNNATPAKHKPNQKNKQGNVPQSVSDYHPVSHSQRVKVTKNQLMMEVINEGVMRREDRNIRLRPKGKSNYEDLNFRLAEVSENPENIKLMRNNPSSNHSSSLNQASPPSFQPSKKETSPAPQ